MDPLHNAEAGIKHYIDNYKKQVQDKTDVLEGNERLFKLFELSYYLHHDGIDAAKPSDKAKTVVLKGTPFLFKVHAILEEEQRSKQQVTGTADYLFSSIGDIVKIVKRYLTALIDHYMVDEQQDQDQDQQLPAETTQP